MGQGLFLAHPEKIDCRWLRNYGRIFFHRECFRIVPLQEQLQLIHHYQVCRVLNYGSQELPVALISLQLPSTVTGPGEVQAFQFPVLGPYVHYRRKTQLEIGRQK